MSGHRLLDRVRDVIRIKHYSIRTEQAYLHSASACRAHVGGHAVVGPLDVS